MSTILIVDDLQDNRYLLRAMLAPTGYEVVEAANGAEALELARGTRPDLIISDILMPQMDGFTLCRELKREEELRGIPFIFYTATYTDPRDEALALQLGADRFIVKPIESDDLIAIIREVMEAHAAGEPAAPPALLEEETVFYRLYNEALIRKLEDKMLDLERLNRQLAARNKEATHRVNQLQALRTIDRAITSSFDLRQTLDVLLQHVTAQLEVDAAAVLLLDPYQQTLSYASGRGFRSRARPTGQIHLGEDLAGRAAQKRTIVQVDDLTRTREKPHFAAVQDSEDFAAYYGVPLIVKDQVKGVLEVFHRTTFHPDADWLSFLETLASQAAIAIDNSQLFEHLHTSNTELAHAYAATIEGWSHAMDLRDKETEGHTQRVTGITLQLARASGIPDAELVHIERGALLHDIGKMGVPDSILLKPDKLTEEEWQIMRAHPQLAHDLISPIDYLAPALDIPYCHHEKWDGTGYPRGLKGEQIPLAARLFAVVDVWDALRSDRPYRKAWPEEQVREHIRSGAGTHFDPKAVELFFNVVQEDAPVTG